MCARYGWTLHYIYSLPFLWFFDQLVILNEALEREYKDDLTLEAFGSWQITETIKMILIGDKNKPIAFGKYLERLNLIDKKPQEEKQTNMTIQQEKARALKSANDILETFRKGQTSSDRSI